MNEDKKFHYVQFPLCLLQMTYKNPTEGLNIILDYGIVYFAKQCKYDLENVGKQLVNAYNNEKCVMQDKLLRLIKKYSESGDLLIEPDKRGYENGTFDPMESCGESIFKLFELDSEFQEMAILRYQIEQAESKGIFNLRDYNIDDTISNYQKGLAFKNAFELKFGADCTPSVKPSMLIDFRDSGKDLDLFRAYIAIKSLIGQHRYVSTTRNVILMRMLGCKSTNALNSFIQADKEAKKLHTQYNRSDKALRYNFDKLFNNLLSKGFLKSKIFDRMVSRKIFLSITMSYDELADSMIEFSKQRNFKKDEQRAKDKIRATI